MSKLMTEIPEDVLCSRKISPEEKGKVLLQQAAMELYKRGDSSHGFCAEMAGMSRIDFIRYLGEHKISIYDFYTPEELEEDIKNA